MDFVSILKECFSLKKKQHNIQRIFLLFEHATVGIARYVRSSGSETLCKMDFVTIKTGCFFNYETYTNKISSLSSLFMSENAANKLT